VADRQDSGPRIAIIIPACNEEACIAAVLEELLATIDPAKCVVAVGVNDTRDRTAEIARRYPSAWWRQPIAVTATAVVKRSKQ
jgi:GT2 family glycosyltransferase